MKADTQQIPACAAYRLIMDIIAGCTTIKKLCRYLKLMPANVIEAYSSTLDHKEVLSWVCCVKRPLQVVELQHALEVDHGSDGTDGIDDENLKAAKTLITVCLGLIMFSKQHQTVSFIQWTAHGLVDHHIHRSIDNSHPEIARTCLTYFLSRRELYSWRFRTLTREDAAGSICCQILWIPRVSGGRWVCFTNNQIFE